MTSFAIRSDEHPHFVLNDHLRMVFVDLSRFQKKSIKELVELRNQWCYLGNQGSWFRLRVTIRGESRVDFVPRDSRAGRMSREQARLLSTKGEDMAKAVGLFDGVPASRLTRLREWSIDRYERDQRSLKALAVEKAMKKGIEQGMQQGRQELILKLLESGFDVQAICKGTGMSEEEIQKLKNGS